MKQFHLIWVRFFFVLVFIVAFSMGIFFNFSKNSINSIEQSSEIKPITLGSCNCKIGDSPENIVTLDEPSSCGKDRLYFQSLLQKVDPSILNARSVQKNAEFPISCVGYIMKKFMDASKKASRFYSLCLKPIGKPVKPKKTHCITEEYVNSVYNSYTDVLDCLDIPQKDLLPKLFNESGMHINTLGSGMDAGVGQLTGPAIASVQQKANFDGKYITWLEMFKEEIGKSQKPSCQRIARIPKLFIRISETAEQRCGLISAPENPLKNVLYTGIFYHYMLRAQTGSRYFKGYTYLPKGNEYERFDRAAKDLDMKGYFADYKIKGRVIELGIAKPNMRALRQMMVTLGYNSGMESAFILLDRYLKARKLKNLKLKESDFNFQTQFSSQLVRKLKDPVLEKKRLADLNAAKSAPYRLPFPIYLKMVQRSGSPGYLSAVSTRLLQLDKEMGNGICTTPDFLKF